MSIVVTVDDVADRWQPLTVEQAALAQVLLDDALELVRAEFPTLDAAVPATVSNRLVVGVLCAMVLRVLKNPNGLRQEQLQNYSYVRDQALSDGSLYLSDAERAQLGAGLSVVSGGAFTIRPYGAPDTSDLTDFE